MKTDNLSRLLTIEEFDQMMAAFDSAGDWMREKLAQGRAGLNPVLQATGDDGEDCSRDDQER